MFDPYNVGHLNSDVVEVTNVFNARPGKLRSFRAVVTLQDHQHKLLFKPNPDARWDQIVVDRLKHLFGLEPMHALICTLSFSYPNADRYDVDIPLPYLMFADKVPARETLEDVEYSTVSRSFRKEVYKITMFRYIVGVPKTCGEHILVRNGVPVSISETVIDGSAIPRQFVEKYIEKDFDVDLMREVQNEMRGRFDHDAMRGIILGTRKPERELKSRKPKYLLTLPAKTIAITIETRLDLVTSCDPEELPSVLTKK